MTRRTAFVLAVAAPAVVAFFGSIFFVPPLTQPPEYHRFADTRDFLGVPNFANVASNLPFLVIGALGVARLAGGRPPGVLPRLRPAYLVFFLGSALVAFGSSYYHWAPSNATLAWDRATMTVAFMAFAAVVVGEQLDVELGRRLLPPLLAVGLGSIVWWRIGDTHGAGDLRPYLLVQFLPLVVLPLLVALFPAPLQPSRFYWGVFGSYVVAKLLELADEPLFALTGVAGHTLKHLAAAAGALFVALAIERRGPAELRTSTPSADADDRDKESA